MNSMKLPYFPLYVRDALSSTRMALMTEKAFKAYWYILWSSWLEIPIATVPNDDRILSILARVSIDEWLLIKDEVLDMFVVRDDDRLENDRLAECADIQLKKSKAGSKGGSKTQANREAKVVASESEASSSSDSSLETEPKSRKSKSVPQGGYLTKNGKVLTKKYNDAFNLFWKAFDYPKAKAAAADSWYNINWPEDSEEKNALFSEIIKAAKSEAVDRSWQIKQGNTPKYPQGWLTERRWEDG